MSMTVVAYIAVGANLGDRRRNIEEAVRTLGLTHGVRVTRVSSLLENPAVGGPAGSPDFLNGVVEVETTLGPHALLHVLLDIERSMGRQRNERWEPRVIDLDLVLYGDQIIQTLNLVIPHPRMHERRFVLKPLAELAPDVVEPVAGITIRELLADLDTPEQDDAPDAAADAVISRSVRCVGCGYNLRGLPIRHACPECGRPTTDSIDPERFEPYLGGNPFRDDVRVNEVREFAGRIGYAPEAVLLVLDSVDGVVHEYADPDGRLHVGREASARQIVDEFSDVVRALFWGDDAAASEALVRWGIKGSEDVGRIVYAMVDAGWFSTSLGDLPDDFRSLFVTTALFGPPAPRPGDEP
jgi:2-amino-4-hydroxy-6-hydroxymethyldihydropteridine diphosphokinase